MNEYAKQWDRQHTGYVAKEYSYGFEYVETEYDKKEQVFKEKKRYVVMNTYFLKL